jgi:hypothetical protein
VVAPVFPSRSLARAWAVACGSSPSLSGAGVVGSLGAWSSVVGPPVRSSCLFCLRLGQCDKGGPGVDCGFLPSRWWPVQVPKQLALFRVIN